MRILFKVVSVFVFVFMVSSCVNNSDRWGKITNVKFYYILEQSLKLVALGPNKEFRHDSIMERAEEIASGREYTLKIEEDIDTDDIGYSYIPIFPYGSIPVEVKYPPREISVGTFTLCEGEIDYKALYREIRERTRAR